MIFKTCRKLVIEVARRQWKSYRKNQFMKKDCKTALFLTLVIYSTSETILPLRILSLCRRVLKISYD